jgi:protein gp37
MARTVPRQGQDPWTVVLHPDRLDQPLTWKKPRRIFVNSLSDLFHENVPFDFVCDVFRVMQIAEQHTFQILTKRPARMLNFVKGICKQGEIERLPPNIWLGVSVENQETADERIPLLLQVPAAVRFISAEPLLGPIDLGRYFNYGSKDERGICLSGGAGNPRSTMGISWTIVGGESGPGSRPCDLAWVRSIKDQCQEAGVACFVKQLGAKPTSSFLTRPAGEDWVRTTMLKDKKGGDWNEWPADLKVREWPDTQESQA